MTVYTAAMVSRTPSNPSSSEATPRSSPRSSPTLSHRFPTKDIDFDRPLLLPIRARSSSISLSVASGDASTSTSKFSFSLSLGLLAFLWVLSLVLVVLLFDRSTSPFPHLSLSFPVSATLTPPPPSPPTPIPAYSSSTGVCILVRAYNKYYSHIPTFMSLMQHNQHPPHLFFNPTDTNSSVAELARLVEKGNRAAGYAFGHVLNVTEDAARRDFPELNQVQEFGYAFTDVSMDMLTSEPQYRGMCQWIMITNVDNIYAGHFLDKVEAQLALGYQMVGLNTISHYNRFACCGDRDATGAGSVDDGTFHAIDIQWVVGGIDLGAVVWNISLWKALNLNFIRMGHEWADGMMVQKFVEANVSRTAIRQFLFIHQ